MTKTEYDWHEWFAWFPVIIKETREIAWLRTVHRKRAFFFRTGNDVFISTEWRYRAVRSTEEALRRYG